MNNNYPPLSDLERYEPHEYIKDMSQKIRRLSNNIEQIPPQLWPSIRGEIERLGNNLMALEHMMKRTDDESL